MTRDDILNALEAFANQRPGLEPGNYFSRSGDMKRYQEAFHKFA